MQGAPGRDLKLENILLTRMTPPEVKLVDPVIAKVRYFQVFGAQRIGAMFSCFAGGSHLFWFSLLSVFDTYLLQWVNMSLPCRYS